MRKLMTLAFALTITAALALTTTSCSKEENLTETPSQPQTQKVHISVNAGVGNDATLRSAMVNEGGKYVLKLTAGDKLYVRGVISAVYDEKIDNTPEKKIMAGMLTIDASSISADGKSASFTGDLTVYDGIVNYQYHTDFIPEVGHLEGEDWVVDIPEYEVIHYDQIEGWYMTYTEGTHSFATSDPLAECLSITAQLVHAGTESNFRVGDDKYGDYAWCVASSVQDLMEHSFFVRADNYDEGKFSLIPRMPILKCTISGLTSGKQYQVEMFVDPDDEAFDAGIYSYEGSTTANGSGVASFAIPVSMGGGDCYYKLVLKTPGESKQVLLGRKSIDTKVYNVSRSATTDPNFPTITWTSVEEPVNPDSNNDLIINGPDDTPAQITLAGTSVDYRFYFPYGATVTLNNLTANNNYNDILSSDADLNLVVNGTNRFNCQYGWATISANGGSLKLSGNGTLIVTSADAEVHGLFGNNYSEEDSEVSELAATGYTVTRSSRTDGPDEDSDGNPDYYTWTYTVAPQ